MIPETLKKHEHSSKLLSHGDGSSSYITDKYCYLENDIKFAVEGLIKFHEDRIEELIIFAGTLSKYPPFDTIQATLEVIEANYESIMAIEHWFEDAI